MVNFINYKFYKYLIDQITISPNKKVGIYSPNNEILENLLLEISGINESEGIFHNDKTVFDNIEFFNKRIYLDCNKKIVNTLLSKKISSRLLINYNIECNSNELKKHIKDLQIRSEGKLKRTYKFTKEGKALVNNAIVLSCNRYPILLNPFENIINEKRINYLKKNYQNKGLIAGVNDLKKYENFLDELILLGFLNILIINPNDKVIVLSNIIDQDEVIHKCDLESILIYKCIQNENMIIINNLNHEQLKKLNNMHVSKEEIFVYNIGDYIC